MAAGIALALFVGSGIAVAAVSSVEAHTPAINADCYGVHVQAWDYSDVANSVSVTIVAGNPDGSDRVEQRTFSKTFDEWFYFADPTIANTYTASIDAPDDTDPTDDNRWDYSWSDTTVGCAKPDVVDVTATACVNPGDLSTVNATLGTLDPAHAYTVRLTGTNGYDSGAAAIQTTTASWSDVPPGFDYTVELVDTTTGLTDSAKVTVIGCPEDASFQVTITQCTTVGGSGTFGVTVSGLVNGRQYVIALNNSAGGAPTEIPFTSDGAPYSTNFTTAPSGTYTVTITDVASGITKTSNPAVFLPCPGPAAPTLDATQCTTTDGISDGSLVASSAQLIPGRTYTITIVTGATTVYSESLAPAGSSTWTTTLYNLDPGTYTLTVTDTTDPASGAFAQSVSSTLAECPSQQTVTIKAVQCPIPGGASDLVATVADFTIGRNYVITLTQAGLPVPGQPVSQNFDPTTTDPGVFSYTSLKPGLTYRVMVTDVTGVTTLADSTAAADTTARAASTARVAGLPVAVSDVDMADCPGNPDVFLTQPTCTVFTTSTVDVGLTDLLVGETYTVAVTNTKDGQPVTDVADQQVTPTTSTASLQFTNLPVGQGYTFTVTNSTKTLSATGEIVLTLCDLETLAYTGASTMTPTLAGLGFLQFGLVLVGISLVRRRSGAREV